MFSVSSDVTISGCSHRYKTRRISCSVWTYQKSWNLERDSLVATTSLLQLISEHFRYFIWRSSKTRTLAYYQLCFYKVFQTIYPDLNFFFFFYVPLLLILLFWNAYVAGSIAHEDLTLSLLIFICDTTAKKVQIFVKKDKYQLTKNEKKVLSSVKYMQYVNVI